jgi:hypothetical protein
MTKIPLSQWHINWSCGTVIVDRCSEPAKQQGGVRRNDWGSESDGGDFDIVALARCFRPCQVTPTWELYIGYTPATVILTFVIGDDELIYTSTKKIWECRSSDSLHPHTVPPLLCNLALNFARGWHWPLSCACPSCRASPTARLLAAGVVRILAHCQVKIRSLLTFSCREWWSWEMDGSRNGSVL